jgi:hypothetical protein
MLPVFGSVHQDCGLLLSQMRFVVISEVPRAGVAEVIHPCRGRMLRGHPIRSDALPLGSPLEVAPFSILTESPASGSEWVLGLASAGSL